MKESQVMFAEPLWLYAGAGTCALLVLLMVWSSRQRKKAMSRLVGNAQVAALTQSLSLPRRRIKQLSLLLATGLLFVALARPQWGYHEETRRQQGVDLLFAIDTSRSMLAEDLRPSRLSRAKLAVEELLHEVTGDRLGLIAFAGDAFLQTPLTHDRTAFLESLHALDVGTIASPGTDLQSAIRVASQAFASEPSHQKVLVLLTDGEDLAGRALAAARSAADDKLTIHTVGIGTDQGALIPGKNADRGGEWLRGPDGELVRSQLDVAALRAVASTTGGTYHLLGADGSGLQQLYRDVLSKLVQQTHSARVARVYHERFQWPLALALALLMVEWLMGERKRRWRRTTAAVAASAAAVAASAAALCLATVHPALADGGDPVRQYNGAVGRYRAGEFEQAVQAYQQTIDATHDLRLQERSYYDLGNALYRAGQAQVEQAPEQAISHYRRAVAAYESALALDGKDEDARFNRDFVKQKLAELEQAQEGEKQKDQPQNGDKQDGDKQDGGKQDGDEQNGGKQDGDKQDGDKQDGDKQDGDKQDGDDGPADQQDSNDGQAGGADKQSPKKGEAAPRGKPEGADPTAADPAKEHGAKPDADAEPDQAGSTQQPESAAADDEHDGAAEGEELARPDEAPGQPPTHGLTHAESKQLLDSLEGELRRLPSGYGQDSAQPSRDERHGKDW